MAFTSTSGPRPNVLWIMSDQHHASCLGHAGRAVRTPNLDAIAARGVRFNRAYCNSPICAPSRVSMITGQYPRTHRHLGNKLYDYHQQNSYTLSAVARRSGYQTAIIGKAHMLGEWDREGFEYIRYCDLCDADLNDPLSAHYFRYLYDHGLAESYDLGNLPPGHPGKETRPFISQIPHEHSVERWTGDETLGFLKARDARRPFFLQMSFQRPHAPLGPPPERAKLYHPDEIDIPESSSDLFDRGFSTKPEFQRRHIQVRGSGYPYVPSDEADLQRHLAYYYCLISMIDEEVGRVCDYLATTDQLKHTAIVYTADHGDFAGEHGLMQKNLGIYEAVHRIPLLLVYPGSPVGAQVGSLVESIDLYPTLCQITGMEAPETIEGTSLISTLEGTCDAKEAVYCEQSDVRSDGMIHAVRTRDFRLVYYDHNASGELYDLRSDPMELVNRFDDPTLRTSRLEMTERLLRYLMKYEKRSDKAHDRRLDERYRNALTQQLHKERITWSDVSRTYRHLA